MFARWHIWWIQWPIKDRKTLLLKEVCADPGNVQAGIIVSEGQMMELNKEHDNWSQDFIIARFAHSGWHQWNAGSHHHHAPSWLATSVAYWEVTKVSRHATATLDTMQHVSRGVTPADSCQCEWDLICYLFDQPESKTNQNQCQNFSAKGASEIVVNRGGQVTLDYWV